MDRRDGAFRSRLLLGAIVVAAGTLGVRAGSFDYVEMSHDNDVGSGDTAATRTVSASTLAHAGDSLGHLDPLTDDVAPPQRPERTTVAHPASDADHGDFSLKR